MKKIVSMLLVLAMALCLLPVSALAAARDESAPQVRVIVENTTFTPETADSLGVMWEDRFWYGTLVDTWITIDDSSTMMSCLLAALDEKGYTQSGAEYNYISEINGLSAFDGGYSGGWMGTLNDWFVNEGFGAFTVAAGTLEAGDEIRILYTSYGYGEDLGGFWSNNDKTVKDVVFSTGELSQAFDPQVHDYVLTVPAGTTGIVVTPTAANKNFQVRTSDEAGQEYKRNDTIPVSDGAVIYVTCGDPSWPTMNGGAYGSADSVPAEQYAFHILVEVDEAVAAVIDKISRIGTVTTDSRTAIQTARVAYDALTDKQKEAVTNYSVLTDAEAALAALDQAAADAVAQKIDAIGMVTAASEAAISEAREAYDALSAEQKALVSNYTELTDAEAALAIVKLPQADAKAVYKSTGDYLQALAAANDPTVSEVGGEWLVLGLARSGREVPEGYYENVLAYVAENINEKGQLHARKSTDNARLILALTAAGYDVTDVGGHNLLLGLSDYDYTVWQGINAAVFALIAYDTGAYEIPTVYDGGVQNSREKLIAYILDAQLEDGGWTLWGNNADTDLTAMAVQSLAPYYDTNADVKAAVDKALAKLSGMQNAVGGFGSVDGSSTESCAQVIVALTALGIDPEKDARFIKNGRSAVDAMCDFYVEDGSFKHIASGKSDLMATEQAYYALTAYARFLDEETSLYDMTDVPAPDKDQGSTDVAPDTTNPETGDSTALPVLFAVMALSLAGLAATAVTVKKSAV